MKFVYSSGGREKYFKALNVGDCVTRAICNATGKDYREVYNELSKRQQKKDGRSARNGIHPNVTKEYLNSIGWKWCPTMSIGQGCTVHLDANELPQGVLIVRLSKHITCVKDGVMYDTYDCSRNSKRCVYGYWKLA